MSGPEIKPPESDGPSSQKVHRPDDRHIPVRSRDLAAQLAGDLERFGEDAHQLLEVAHAMDLVIAQEAWTFDHLVSDAYVPFSPDADEMVMGDEEQRRGDEAMQEIRCYIDYILEKANFKKLSKVEIDQAISTANSFGMKVRLNSDRVEEMGIWVRGLSCTTRRFRAWNAPLRGRERELDVYQRLAVLVRLKGERWIRLKLYREIPTADVEALLPHAEVCMNLFDRVTFLGGTAAASATAMWKLIAALLAGGVAVVQLTWLVLFGAGGAAIKGFLNYRKTRLKRTSQRTSHLYFQNLASNHAVLGSLMHMITQEELKEAILGYAVCWKPDSPITSIKEADRQAEAYLLQRFDTAVNFDMHDAVESLERFNLFEDRAAFRVVPPDEAVRRLDLHRRDRKSKGYHARMAEVWQQQCIEDARRAREIPLPPQAELVREAQRPEPVSSRGAGEPA